MNNVVCCVYIVLHHAMRKSDVLKFLIGSFLAVTLLLLVAFNALLVWVAITPRQIDNITPMLEAAFIDKQSGFRLEIGQSWLIWDGWQHPIDIRLKHVELIDSENHVLSTFPEISLGLDPIGLFMGQVLPNSLAIKNPVLSFKQSANKTLELGLKPSEKTDESPADKPSAITALVESLINPKSGSSLRKLRRVELLHANISINDDAGVTVIDFPDMDFYIRRESSTELMGRISATAQYHNSKSTLNGQFVYNKTRKRLEGLLDFGALDVSKLADIFTQDSPAKGIELVANGQVGFAFNISGKLEKLKVKIESGKGKITLDQLPAPINFSSIKLEALSEGEFEEITLKTAEIKMSGSLLSATGTLTRGEAGIGITGEGSVHNLATEQVADFWPPTLAPLTREWVTTNIFDGGIPNASVKINLKPGEIDLPVLPKEAVDANIELKDAKIRYLPGHPPVNNVNAHIKVDGLSMEALVSSAHGFTDTKLTNGRVYIADLNPDNPLLEVSMHADAPATDIATLLGLPQLEHAKHLNVFPDKVSGRAMGDVTLGFYFFSKDAEGNDTPVTLDIKATAQSLSTPALLKKFDIANANGEFSITENEIHYRGSGTVNGAALSESAIHYLFEPKDGMDTTIKASGTGSQEALQKFGVIPPANITGEFPFTLDATFGEHVENIAATAELGTNEIHMPRFSYHKPAGEAATLEIKTVLKDGITTIPNIIVKTSNANLSGSGSLTPGGKDLGLLELNHFTLGRTKLNKLNYTKTESGYNISMAGESLDASGYITEDSAEEEGGFSFEKFPAANISIDVATVYAANDVVMNKVKGTLLCDAIRCNTANIKGNIGEKTFSFVISGGKKRRLNIASTDAGNLLRALDIEKVMYDGELNIHGEFDDSRGNSVLRGNLEIRDYVLKDAPILAKLLTLTSLTGFFDTLSGNGISFKKMQVPFTIQDDVITIKDGKTYGPAIGLMAEGTLTFPAVILDMKGTIVPSYSANSVVGKIPLLGDILTGGDGGGVFAARYTIKGDSENPEVSVNPLSILTPGFLRNMFDAF